MQPRMTRRSTRRGTFGIRILRPSSSASSIRKTGKVVEYPVPLNRHGTVAQGGLQIAFDREGRVYFGNMSQMQIVRLDPKTEKMETFKPPVSETCFGDGHLTMIDPSFQHVDGKLWINVADGTDEAGGTWHVDLATNTWTHVTYPRAAPPLAPTMWSPTRKTTCTA